MKILKWFLIIVAAIILLYLLCCVIGPKDVNMTRSTTMKASPAQAFNLVNDLPKWESWSPWSERDTSMVINYPGKTEGIGASYTWKGDLSGTGSLEIIESSKNESLKTELKFGGYDGSSFGIWNFEKEDDETKVSWRQEAEPIPFMVRGMMLLRGAKKSMANDFDEGLENIKAIAEERAKGIYDGYKINNVELAEKHFVLNRQMVNIDQLQAFYMRNLPSISVEVSKAGLDTDGMPCGLFYKWDEVNGKTDMAAAIPVKKAVNLKGLMSTTIDARKALQVDYYGDYSGTQAAHFAIDAYVKDHGLFTDFPIIEQYVTDPGTEEDPSKWLTQVTYYLAQEN